MGTRAAAIDIGSNTIKLAVGEIGPEGLALLANRSAYARLGEAVDKTAMLSNAAQDRAMKALAEHVSAARELGVDRVRAVATSAVRDAVNRADFVDRVRRELGLEVEVLTGEQEARLSYMAVALDPMLGRNNDERITVDTGGGSTDVTFGSGMHMYREVTVNIGAVRLTERCIAGDPPSFEEIDSALREAEVAMRAVGLSESAGRVVGIGGGAVNLARIHLGLQPDRTQEVHGTVLTDASLRKLVGHLAAVGLAERKRIVGLDPERADVIVAGAIILERALAVLGSGELAVSIRGLRHGVLYEMLADDES